MMQHKISGGQSRAGYPGRPYCIASSCPGFCVHDIPLKLIRRFELFSYLIQFVTGCKTGVSFYKQLQLQSEYKAALLVSLYLGASW